MRTFGSHAMSSLHVPHEVRRLVRRRRAHVHDEVEILELEPLWHVGVAQARAHVRVLVHQREDPVHHLAELLRAI